jgi:hypothetical protein
VDDVDDRHAGAARPCEEVRDARDRGRPVGQDDLANRREVFLLSVNYEKGGLVHRGPSLSGGGRRAGACYHAASVNLALGIGGDGGVSGEGSMPGAGRGPRAPARGGSEPLPAGRRVRR